MNAKMKVLSLALVGVFGYAGAAMADCPAGPTTADGGAWSAKSTLGGTLAVTGANGGGLDGSECRLDTQITTNGPGVNAFVRDDSPNNEPRYRAQFYVDADALGSLTTIQSVKVLGATTTAGAENLTDVVRLSILGNLSGSTKNLGIFTACSGQSGGQCSASTPLAAGVNKIEIDWNQAAGTLKVWVNSNTEATATTTVTGNSAPWGGVDFATLGLAAPSAGFRSAHLNQVVKFDRFDSRRQTFIGF